MISRSRRDGENVCLSPRGLPQNISRQAGLGDGLAKHALTGNARGKPSTADYRRECCRKPGTLPSTLPSDFRVKLGALALYQRLLRARLGLYSMLMCLLAQQQFGRVVQMLGHQAGGPFTIALLDGAQDGLVEG